MSSFAEEEPSAVFSLRRQVNLTTLCMCPALRNRTCRQLPCAGLERAGIEFGLTSQTLRRSLAKTSATPDADGLFTTKQIVAAVYGAFDQEKLATQKQLTRKYEIANAIAEASVLDGSELAKVLAGIADAMVHRIMASELSRSAKQDLLHDLSSIPLVLDEVADRQTALPRRRNGQTSDEDGSED